LNRTEPTYSFPNPSYFQKPNRNRTEKSIPHIPK